MRIRLYILLFTLFAFQQGYGQTFTVAHDTMAGSAFQCIVPPNKWRGNMPYGQFLNAISFPGAPKPIKWHVVASDFPDDWLPNFAIQDSAGFYYNTLRTVWNGTSGNTYTTFYPAAGGQFNYYISEGAMVSVGTHWMEVNLKDSTSSYSVNIWFIVTRDRSSIGDSLAGPSNVCPGATIKLVNPLSNTGVWMASNANATVADSIITGVSAGLDTIKYAGAFTIMTSADTCTFIDTVTKTVNIYPSPNPPVTVAGSTLYAPSGYTSYQWLFASSPISGATSSSYVMLTNGVYAVAVTDNHSCYGSSSPYFEEYLSVPSVTAGPDIKIFPNPANTIVNINASYPVNVRLCAFDGHLLQEQLNATVINLKGLPAGVYLLTVYDARSGTVIKAQQITKTDN